MEEDEGLGPYYDHVAFHVEDLEECARLLVEHDVPHRFLNRGQRPASDLKKMPLIVMRDPDGINIVLYIRTAKDEIHLQDARAARSKSMDFTHLNLDLSGSGSHHRVLSSVPPIPLQEFAYRAISVCNVPEAIDFYCNVLGFRPKSPPFRWLDLTVVDLMHMEIGIVLRIIPWCQIPCWEARAKKRDATIKKVRKEGLSYYDHACSPET